jgi:hypothetical protein
MGTTELHPAERQVREEFAARLEEQANLDGLEPAIGRAMRVRAGKIRSAMPYLDLKRALAALNDQLDAGPSTGLEYMEHRAGIDQAKAKVKEDNQYPPGLEQAVDQALARGMSADDLDLFEVLGVPNPAAEKSRSGEPLSRARLQARIEKAVGDRLADLGLQTHLLRRDLDRFKAEQTRFGARFDR